ncbi:hypothetical protein [Bifidobacterium cuniculi]|uniref:hypothetical protein n=1 Tax=Bifidobacterium cuniculi TaxID=1688 RepID=UPI001269BF5A|nr:hypothetical protein [Bifidobacterium cuniculi]
MSAQIMNRCGQQRLLGQPVYRWATTVELLDGGGWRCTPSQEYNGVRRGTVSPWRGTRHVGDIGVVTIF